MKITPAEIIDRMSIVKLKIEKIGNPKFNEEFEALKGALDEFKREGIEIKEEWFNEIYETNKEEWNLLEQMNEERGGEKNFAKIGQIYLQTELVNKKRSEIKNKIIEETGKGFKEIKKNHPSA
jgi:hypothetical protein